MFLQKYYTIVVFSTSCVVVRGTYCNRKPQHITNFYGKSICTAYYRLTNRPAEPIQFVRLNFAADTSGLISNKFCIGTANFEEINFV